MSNYYSVNFLVTWPVFNRITSRVMYCCSIAFTKSVQLFHYSHFVWYIFQTRPLFDFLFLYHLHGHSLISAVFFIAEILANFVVFT